MTLSLALACTLISCSPNPQSASKKYFEDKIERESGGKLKLASYKLEGGRKTVVESQEFFDLDYSAVLEYKEDGWRAAGDESRDFKLYKQQPESGAGNGPASYKFHKKGESEDLAGIVRVKKVEDDWQIIE